MAYYLPGSIWYARNDVLNKKKCDQCFMGITSGDKHRSWVNNCIDIYYYICDSKGLIAMFYKSTWQMRFHTV